MKFKNGEFSGKGKTAIGYMTAYKSAGVNIFRSIPENVKVSKEQPSLNSRKRFSTLSKLVKGLSQVLVQKTLPMKPGENYRNAGSTYNSAAVTVDSSGRVDIDYGNVVISKGSLTSENATGSFDGAANKYLVNWTTQNLFGTSPDDSVRVAIYNETEQIVSTIEEDARASNEIIIDTSAILLGQVCHAYLYIKSANGNRFSDSLYLGKFTT
jgi:hypothetical protein